MGKIRKKRIKVSRYSPTSIQTNIKYRSSVNESNLSQNILEVNRHPISYLNDVVNEPNNGMEEESTVNTSFSTKVQGLKTAHDKISCSVAEERMTGLNMLAAMALELKAAESIVVQNRMVIFMAPLLNDCSSQVRLAAAGALRNLCAWGLDNIIDQIILQDVLQPLSKLLKTYEADAPDSTTVSEALASPLNYSKGIAHSMTESDPQNLIFIHATNVLWSLCECNEEAIVHFNREGLVNILLKYINPFIWGYDIALASADCLFCVSENNPKATSAILPLAEELFSVLFKTLSEEHSAHRLHFAVVISGVLYNINYWSSGDTKCCKVLEVLSKVLEFDASSLFSNTQPMVQSKATIQECFDHIISAQLIAFEILSNICCPDDEENWQECEEDFEESDMAVDGQMEFEEEEGGKGQLSHHLSPEMVEGMKYFQLVQKTHEKITSDGPGGSVGKHEEEKDISDKFSQLKVRGLQCLQNLINCLHIDDLGGSDSMYTAWTNFGQMFYSNSSDKESGILEAISGVMRATIEKLSESGFSQMCNLPHTDLQMIFTAGSSCSNSSVRANLCRMVGSLGCSLIKHNSVLPQSGNPTDVLTEITEFLLQISLNDSALWVQAEALDVLIDIFSDDKTDSLAARVRLVERLKEINPQFKAKYNQERKKLGDHYPLVLTVKENLLAFIKYKGQRISKEMKLDK